jgi:uncharacterized damage-inducible protein DinB
MTEQALPLTMFYKGWDVYQQSLVEIIAPLSPEQLAFPAASHHWSIGLVVQHMIAGRIWWFQMWMGEGSPDLASIANWDPLDGVEQPPLDAAELVAGLEATWHMIADALARWTPADLGHIFLPPSHLSAEEKNIFQDLTRQWIIWHVLEHEISHGGELSLALGAHELMGVYGNA